MRCLSVLLVCFLFSGAVSAELPLRQLKVSGHVLSVEVANTHAARARGLMFRQSLHEGSGMLFVFPQAGQHSMWMMNTDIPLSVAFLDEKGVILNIADMMPRTATVHRSAGVAKYALETNLGWFGTRNIAAGAKVAGLEKVPPAE
ncbi:DUF192 domain-containing protein [Nitrosospira sp. Is2]|uniref:DUF192 domain-containing protein n=1 Tax=Nitrosospira sp. Is2 TaxID=3080532 RepID=UPI002955DB0F|nr:DUF192 domain-containing protein [Nitrosospira sp. Is2]WON74604.1 DUF192 domain-containing protein [Nitrosospira sp. Is2]